MGCCATSPLNPDLPVRLPGNIKRLSTNSDPALLKQVEDVMTKSFTGSTTHSPEGGLAWCFDPDGSVDDDYSKPLKAPPSKEREAVMRFVIKFSMAISAKHNSLFALFEEDEYGKATDVVVGASALLPPNTSNLHDPGICEFIALGLTSPPPEVMQPRMDKVLSPAMKEGHKKWAHDPHWYVFCIAMDAEKQGKGYGRKLMEFICSIADATELPLYLETHGPRNQRFYENNGFEVKEGKNLKWKEDKPLDKHGGCLMMVRSPKK